MYRYLAISCMLICLTFSVKATIWRDKLDSLQTLLTKELSDEDRMNTLLSASSLLSTVNPSEAMEYAVKASTIAKELNSKKGIVKSILNQCDFYSTIGEYDVSLEMAYEALKLAEPDAGLMSECHNRVATIHAGMDNFPATLKHNRQALYYASQVGDSSRIVIHLHNIGRIFTDLHEYDSALHYLRFTNNYEIRHHNRPDPYSLTNIGNVYLELGKYDSALAYHMEAYEYDVKSDEKMLMAIDQQFIAITYFKMSKYPEAKDYAQKSIQIAKENEVYDLALENYETLYKIYKDEGNYPAAFEYAMLYKTTRDTLYERTKQSLIINLETKYRVREQQEKLELLEELSAEKDEKLQLSKKKENLSKKKEKLSDILAYVSILLFISMAIIVFLVYRRQRMYRELTRQLRLANDSKEKLLSIIGHDLRGSVGTLKGAASAIMESAENTKDVRELLQSFYPVADSTYDLLENLLTWAKYNKEKIRPVYAALNMKEMVGMAIDQIRPQAAAKSIDIINNIPDFTIESDKNMVLSILRNILSNSIKFSHSKSKVLISGEESGNAFLLSIADNGVGMDEKTRKNLFEQQRFVHSAGTLGERGSGLGLMICKTFIDSLGGEIRAESILTKGTTFHVSLPVQKPASEA